MAAIPWDDSETTLTTIFADSGRYGDREAIVFVERGGEARWTYRELCGHARGFAGELATEGVGRADTVALSARNQPEWIVICLGIVLSGATVVPIDTQLDEEALRHVLLDCEAKRLVTASTDRERLQKVCADIGIDIMLLREDGNEGDGAGDRRGPHADGKYDFPAARPDDTAVLFYTSGTTGPPKGVPLTHRNLLFQIRTIAGADLVREDDRILLPLPLHHVYPFVVGMLTPLALGLPLVMPSAFTGSQVLSAVRKGQATMIIGVPRLYDALVSGLQSRMRGERLLRRVILERLLDTAVSLRRRFGLRLGKYLLKPVRDRIGPHLRVVVSGGAALKADTAFFLEGLGWRVGTGYGLTETAPLLTINPPGRADFATAGRAVPGVDIRIDRDAAPEGAGEGVGEILARGPGVFSGYHNLPDKTREAFTEDGWFRTGDLGSLDERGFLNIAGRKSTTIVTEGGENVQPDEIEEAYQAHPAIAEIAVIEKDRKIVGLIVPDVEAREGSEIEDAVRQAVGEVSRRLPSYQRLADFAITREAIPRTRLGKPRRHRLAELYDQARHEQLDAAPQKTGPMPLDEMSAEDRALVEDPAGRAAWDWLAERYADRRLTPDSHVQIDLGIDSMEWLDISLEMAERTGVELDEERIAEIESVRDLLAEVVEAGGEGGGAAQVPWEDPDAALSDMQRNWLRSLGPASKTAAGLGHSLNRSLMRTCFRVHCTGRENLPAEGPVILAPNHTSYLDPFALAACLDDRLLQRTYWAGWTGIVFRGPLRRRFARLGHAVPVDPQRAIASSLAFGGAVLKRGKALVWFPEGRRSEDGSLQDFKAGIGRLLEHYPVPVVPVVIRGAHEAWPVRKRLPRFRPLTVEIHAPLDPSDLGRQGEGDSTSQRIVEALHAHMQELVS